MPSKVGPGFTVVVVAATGRLLAGAAVVGTVAAADGRTVVGTRGSVTVGAPAGTVVMVVVASDEPSSTVVLDTGSGVRSDTATG